MPVPSEKQISAKKKISVEHCRDLVKEHLDISKRNFDTVANIPETDTGDRVELLQAFAYHCFIAEELQKLISHAAPSAESWQTEGKESLKQLSEAKLKQAKKQAAKFVKRYEIAQPQQTYARFHREMIADGFVDVTKAEADAAELDAREFVDVSLDGAQGSEDELMVTAVELDAQSVDSAIGESETASLASRESNEVQVLSLQQANTFLVVAKDYASQYDEGNMNNTVLPEAIFLSAFHAKMAMITHSQPEGGSYNAQVQKTFIAARDLSAKYHRIIMRRYQKTLELLNGAEEAIHRAAKGDLNDMPDVWSVGLSSLLDDDDIGAEEAILFAINQLASSQKAKESLQSMHDKISSYCSKNNLTQPPIVSKLNSVLLKIRRLEEGVDTIIMSLAEASNTEVVHKGEFSLFSGARGMYESESKINLAQSLLSYTQKKLGKVSEKANAALTKAKITFNDRYNSMGFFARIFFRVRSWFRGSIDNSVLYVRVKDFSRSIVTSRTADLSSTQGVTQVLREHAVAKSPARTRSPSPASSARSDESGVVLSPGRQGALSPATSLGSIDSGQDMGESDYDSELSFETVTFGH